ncbi:MAG: hypothetical protein GYB65_23550 [Chloroflexi bacterium]|nr:hypothetical protein [Chloroflexota bacterium]
MAFDVVPPFDFDARWDDVVLALPFAAVALDLLAGFLAVVALALELEALELVLDPVVLPDAPVFLLAPVGFLLVEVVRDVDLRLDDVESPPLAVFLSAIKPSAGYSLY